MSNAINENAEYIVILTGDKRKIYIDAHDIENIQIGQQVKIDGLEDNYNIVLITWKEPLSQPWQVFMNADNQSVWNGLQAKNMPETVQNNEKLEENDKNN